MQNLIDVQVIADDGLPIAIGSVYGSRIQLDDIVSRCIGEGTGRVVIGKTIAIGLPPDMAEFDEPRRAKKRWCRALEHQGWLVETIEGVPTPDRDAPYRADVDPLVIRALQSLPNPSSPLSTVLLLGADHAFGTSVRDARRRGWRVEVTSIDRITSDDLKRAATDTIDVTPFITAASSNTASVQSLSGIDLSGSSAA